MARSLSSKFKPPCTSTAQDCLNPSNTSRPTSVAEITLACTEDPTVGLDKIEGDEPPTVICKATRKRLLDEWEEAELGIDKYSL